MSIPKTYRRHVTVTIHQFKSNIAAYLRALEEGRMRAVMIKRYDRPVAVVTPFNAKNICYPDDEAQ